MSEDLFWTALFRLLGPLTIVGLDCAGPRGWSRGTLVRRGTTAASTIARLRTPTLDLSRGYRLAIAAAAPHVQLIFDRCHIQGLAHWGLDEDHDA